MKMICSVRGVSLKVGLSSALQAGGGEQGTRMRHSSTVSVPGSQSLIGLRYQIPIYPNNTCLPED